MKTTQRFITTLEKRFLGLLFQRSFFIRAERRNFVAVVVVVAPLVRLARFKPRVTQKMGEKKKELRR